MNLRPMTDVEKRSAAKAFVETWTERGDEKQDAQNFWRMLLQSVYGMVSPESEVLFEHPVKKDAGKNNIFIDAYIKDTAVLIEQKGKDIDLHKKYKQSDGEELTPYGQARRYAGLLPHSMNPRWIVVSNFQEIDIHDMNTPNDDPHVVYLADLEKEYHRLNFLIDTGSETIRREMEISKKAGDLVGLLYDALLKQYKDPTSEHTLKSLNALCVRIVFCLYAEDADIFGHHLMFHDYVQSHTPQQTRKALIALFRVLDQKPEERDPYLADDDPLLAAFPYVNGGLFSDENVEIPPINDEIYHLILRDASEDFDWSEISPTIFGAMFESTLNPVMRRQGGMHYTSIENIHKVIDPLFLDDLKFELDSIIAEPVARTKKRKLDAFHDKLASLEFLDPAAGSGNFLTESYLSLRRLENRLILEQTGGQIMLGAAINPIRVSITQFHGIEINDFAVTVARTALWIAESQMMKETEDIVHMQLDFLPLKTQANIVEGNALRLDWNDVVDSSRLSYIMGNPPFGGKKEQTATQKLELLETYRKNTHGVGNMDYVTAWYVKAAAFMSHSTIVAAFVSTNSITQGEQPPVLWTSLAEYDIRIVFAYKSFVWNSEANDKAHVHCVIIGFCSGALRKKPRIYQDKQYIEAENINPYIIDAPTVIIPSRNKPICDVPPVVYGSMPIDKNHLILGEDDVQEALKEDKNNSRFIREYVGGVELLQGKKRWCLWLAGIDPADYMKSRFVMERVEATRNYRLHESDRPQTIKAAETPHLFGEIRQPQNGALVIPKVSSEDRLYIPISYVGPGIIINGSALMIPDATMYHFGVLSSNVHNSWMRLVAGRMKSDYQYSVAIVYNNFPWPEPNERQIQAIEEAAKGVLAARDKHSNVSLANIYKKKNYLLFADLKAAHDRLNQVVLAAYGIKKGDPAYSSESACVAFLMKRYQELTSNV